MTKIDKDFKMKGKNEKNTLMKDFFAIARKKIYLSIKVDDNFKIKVRPKYTLNLNKRFFRSRNKENPFSMSMEYFKKILK